MISDKSQRVFTWKMDSMGGQYQQILLSMEKHFLCATIICTPSPDEDEKSYVKIIHQESLVRSMITGD